MAIPYRADQLGSLLRPPRLKEARSAYNEGRLDLDGLRAVEDQAIRDALDVQRQSGIEIFTDGEYRREVFYDPITEAVDGFVTTDKDVRLDWRGPGGDAGPTPSPAVGAKLHQKRRLTAHEVSFLQQHAPGPFKITLPSAQQFLRAAYRPGITEQAYPSRADLSRDLTGIIRREIEALIAEGVPYVQIDAPWYDVFVDDRLREGMRQRGSDPEQALAEAIAADN